jgi:hypothetical protein
MSFSNRTFLHEQNMEQLKHLIAVWHVAACGTPKYSQTAYQNTRRPQQASSRLWVHQVLSGTHLYTSVSITNIGLFLFSNKPELLLFRGYKQYCSVMTVHINRIKNFRSTAHTIRHFPNCISCVRPEFAAWRL